MNATEVTGLLWLVASHWPSFRVEDGDRFVFQLGAWQDMVADLDLAACRAAVAALDAEGREFAPTPGQIRAEVLAAAGVGPPPFDVALAELLGAARDVGRRGVPAFSHDAIGDAVRALGGWSTVCNSENPEALRAHFRDAYTSAVSRHRRAGLPSQAALPPGPARPRPEHVSRPTSRASGPAPLQLTDLGGPPP